MRLREEVAYGATSSQATHVLPYGTLSFRMASQRAGAERVGLGKRTRTAQLLTPLLLDGRYSYGADQDLAEVIDWAAASRTLFDTLFKRKTEYASATTHSGASLGDLRSWNVEVQGPNTKETQLARGCKAKSIQISTKQGNKRGAKPIMLQVQYHTDNVIGATYTGQDAEVELFPRRAPGELSLAASRIRVTPAATAIGTNLANEIVQDAEGFNLRCTRQVGGTPNPSGGVNSSGDSIPLEPFVADERWSVKFDAPVYDSSHTVAQGLVDSYWSAAPLHPRYNVRIDIGGANRTIYTPIHDSGSSQLNDWYPNTGAFTAPGPGVVEAKIAAGLDPYETARVFAVYGLETTTGLGQQFAPKSGDTIRFSGRQGPPGAETDLAYGGYVLTVGDSKIAADGAASEIGWGNGTAKSLLDALHATTGTPPLPSGFPDPSILVWMWCKGYLHTPPSGADSTHEYMVPGGLSIELKNVALSLSEGLRPKQAAYDFMFESDALSEVVITY